MKRIQEIEVMLYLYVWKVPWQKNSYIIQNVHFITLIDHIKYSKKVVKLKKTRND
jgi:hypothetical protein